MVMDQLERVVCLHGDVLPRRRTKGRQTSSVGDEDEKSGSAVANTATTAEATTEAVSRTSVSADVANTAQQTGVSSTVVEGAQSVAAGK